MQSCIEHQSYELCAGQKSQRYGLSITDLVSLSVASCALLYADKRLEASVLTSSIVWTGGDPSL